MIAINKNAPKITFIVFDLSPVKTNDIRKKTVKNKNR